MSDAAVSAPSIDFAARRRAMVDCQLRTFEVTDPSVLAAFETAPREIFVGPGNAAVAYSDSQIRLRMGSAQRVLLAPMVLARLIQAAEIGPQARVLDVAGATGYSAAILAALAGSVVTLEDDAAFTAAARANLAQLEIANVRAETGALREGFKDASPYDVILVNGAVEDSLYGLFGQLAPGGRLLAVLRRPGQSGLAAKATRFDRIGSDISPLPVFDAAAAVLPAFARAPAFVF
jgi:protein-L-isoaspartate(D-aspartate) O-methyltransferase